MISFLIRRYARTDEIGIPFGVTVDFQSLIDSSVTLRERDSMHQLRIPVSQLGSSGETIHITQVKEIAHVVASLVNERTKWKDQTKMFPIFKEQMI